MEKNVVKMSLENNPKEIVLNYIKNLDEFRYNEAGKFLTEKVQIIGPAGESFTSTNEFLKMLQSFKAKYDIMKVFVDGEDVCLLYDMKMSEITAYTASWYHLKNNKIAKIRTIFDSKLFS